MNNNCVCKKSVRRLVLMFNYLKLKPKRPTCILMIQKKINIATEPYNNRCCLVNKEGICDCIAEVYLPNFRNYNLELCCLVLTTIYTVLSLKS